MTTWNEYFEQKSLGIALKSGNRVSLGRDRYGEPALLVFKGESQLEFVRAEAEQLRDFLNDILPGGVGSNIRTPGGATIVGGCEARECSAGYAPSASTATASAMEEDLKKREREAKEGMDRLMPPPAAPTPAPDSAPTDDAAPGDEEVEAPGEEPPAPDPAPSGTPTTFGAALLKEIAEYVEKFDDWAVTMPIFVNHNIDEKNLVGADGKTLIAIRDELKARWEKRLSSTKKADSRTCFPKRKR